MTMRRSRQVWISALPDCGYTGTTVPVMSLVASARSSSGVDSTSTTGLVIWRLPRYWSTLPKSDVCVPTGSWRSRHGWLKNTRSRSPVPSYTVAFTIVRLPSRVRRDRIERTSASIVASSPIASSAMSARSVRST